MGLVVLAFPQLSENDFKFIQKFREVNDRYFPIVNPHLTLVFPAYGLKENEVVDHIVKTAADLKKIEFSLNCAITVKDSFSEFWDIFLVPEKGNSSIIKLHDALYRGPLITHLRIDIPFIPHMGIGNDVDPFHCINLARELNDADIAIPGIISNLSIGHFDGSKLEIIKELPLK